MKPLACVAAACLAACAGPGTTAPAPKLNQWGRPERQGVVVPSWVDRLPENGNGRLLAVGYSAPSYWPQDSIDHASDDARGKLALALTSHIEVLGLDVATGAGAGGGATIDKEATDVVMQNSRIEATWVDENGDRGDPGSVWALAAIDIGAVHGRSGAGQNAQASWSRGTGLPGPAWLNRLPGAGGKLFAAGYSGPTYRPEDAVKYAGDNAVDNLAASLRAHVQAYTLLVENASGLTMDEFSHKDDPDGAFLDLVRKNARVESTWVDAQGARPGDAPGAVWALASIDVQSTKGGVQAVDDPDLGPALDNHGDLPAASAPAAARSQSPATSAGSTVLAQPAVARTPSTAPASASGAATQAPSATPGAPAANPAGDGEAAPR